MALRRFPTRVVLLDWDGTLLDSYASDKNAYFAMFRALQIKWGVAEIERHYSPDWYRVYRAARIPRPRVGFVQTGSGEPHTAASVRVCLRAQRGCCANSIGGSISAW